MFNVKKIDNTMNKLPIYNIVLGEADGIQKMSLVDCPAVEIDFLKFSKEDKHNLSFSVIDEEQHIVFGCALRSNFPIYRYSEKLGEYYVVFTKETIKELYEKFMITGKSSNVNLNHSIMTEGVSLIQSFIKDTEKGINPVGFEDCEDGSWFVSYKVNNEDVWKSVKNGEFNGFSIEGTFELEPIQLSKQEVGEFDELINELLN